MYTFGSVHTSRRLCRGWCCNEDLDVGEGDRNPLSSEGMKHAFATQKVGGVMLTEASELTRTVNVNLVARGPLREPIHANGGFAAYILGLALIAVTLDQT